MQIFDSLNVLNINSRLEWNAVLSTSIYKNIFIIQINIKSFVPMHTFIYAYLIANCL